MTTAWCLAVGRVTPAIIDKTFPLDAYAPYPNVMATACTAYPVGELWDIYSGASGAAIVKQYNWFIAHADRVCFRLTDRRRSSGIIASVIFSGLPQPQLYLLVRSESAFFGTLPLLTGHNEQSSSTLDWVAANLKDVP